MPTYDTLTYAGTEQSMHDWGFSIGSIKGSKANGRDDTFTATIANTTIAAESATPTFPFEALVTVRTNRTLSGTTYSGGTVKFVGKRVTQPMKASASGQGVTYEFRGPSYDLKNTDYLQLFQGNGQTYYLPETVLFTGYQSVTAGGVTYGWLPISVGDQIQDILQFLLAQYAAQGMAAPFQYSGRALNAGAIDLTSNNAMLGTPGGNYNFYGYKYNYHLAASPSIDPTLYSLFLPSYVQKPMKCWEALEKCLQLSQRVNIWFDYSVSPPLIRFDLVDNMTAVTLPLFTGAKNDGTLSHKSITITPRYDLQLRAVTIKYRITDKENNRTVVDYVIDKWSGNGVSMGLPGAGNVNLNGSGNNATDPNAGLRVMNEMIDLSGVQITTQEGHMDLEPLACRGGSQSTKRAWWSSKRGGEVAKLEDFRARFGSNTIPDAQFYYSSNGYDSTGQPVTAGQEFTVADYGFYVCRIVRGAYHSWMKQTAGILSCKCKVKAAMKYQEYNCTSATSSETDTTGIVIKKATNSDEHANIEVTNAVPDTGSSGYANFSVLSSLTPPELYIVGSGGIAQYLYNHYNTLQYDGDYVAVNANFIDSGSAQYVTLGNVLNLSGGAAAWTTMRAQIQEITEDYGTHTTTVKIGITKMLKAQQLSELLNMWRNRRPWYNPALRTDNTQISGGTVDMAEATAIGNTLQGLQDTVYGALYDYSTLPVNDSPGVANSGIISDASLVTAAMNL